MEHCREMAHPCTRRRADTQTLSASFLSLMFSSPSVGILEFRAVTPLENLAVAQLSLRQCHLP